jgi:hypothetical protein
MYDHSLALVDDDDPVVLVENRQRDVLWNEGRGVVLFVLDYDIETVAVFDQTGKLGGLAADARRNEPQLELAAGEELEFIRDIAIEPDGIRRANSAFQYRHAPFPGAELYPTYVEAYNGHQYRANDDLAQQTTSEKMQ